MVSKTHIIIRLKIQTRILTLFVGFAGVCEFPRNLKSLKIFPNDIPDLSWKQNGAIDAVMPTPVTSRSI